MIGSKKKINNQMEKKAQFFTDNNTRCKCGHTMLIVSKDGKKLCSYCKEYVFINKEAEIKYRNKEALIRAKRELNNE